MGRSQDENLTKRESDREEAMRYTHLAIFSVVLVCLSDITMGALGSAARADPMEPLIAIDVLVEPDATMIAAAHAVNARLREVYPEGYSLDESHAPHITLLQRYVREPDLGRVTAAVAQVLLETDPRALQMRAIGYEYVVWAGVALTGIAVERSPDLVRLHERITEAVAPFAVSGGTSAAFAQGPGSSAINAETMAYVENFVPKVSGANYAPHVTVGVGPESFGRELNAGGLTPFMFGARGVAVYRLGDFGTAQKRLWGWDRQ
jgi:hypothetical protein